MLLAVLTCFLAAVYVIHFFLPESWTNNERLAMLEDHRAKTLKLLQSKTKRWTVEEFKRDTAAGAKLTVAEGAVVDLSRFPVHPGGDFLDRFIGRDCTPWLLITHTKSPIALQKVRALTVGALEKGQERALLHAREQEYLELHEAQRQAGTFAAAWKWLIGDASEVAVLIVGGLWLWFDWNSPGLGLLVATLGGCRQGIFYHDIGHQSVFMNASTARSFNMYTSLFVWGFDFHAPCAIHAVHHAFVNIVGLDTALEMGPVVVHPAQASSHWGVVQNVLFYGFLVWLVFPYYAISGVIASLHAKDYGQAAIKVVRLVLMVLFWKFSLPLMLAAILGFVYFAVVGSLNHFHKPIAEEDSAFGPGAYPAFVPMQTTSVQNTTTTPFRDWALGHFTLHAEHHLFPHMPRRRYNALAPTVEAFLKRWGLPYSVCSQGEALKFFNVKLKNPF